MKLSDLNVQVYADGAVIDDMVKAKESEIVKGFTTNPSLMKKAGVKDYMSFAKELYEHSALDKNDFELISKPKKSDNSKNYNKIEKDDIEWQYTHIIFYSALLRTVKLLISKSINWLKK